MQKLVSFIQLSLDGYLADANGGISRAKANEDAEFQAFVEQNASGEGLLPFGRITYQMMASWPSPLAQKNDPVVAQSMNSQPKIVFSKTLGRALWNNSRLVKGDLAAKISKLKKEDGKAMAILGSGSIVSQRAEERLIDEFQIMLNPVAPGNSRSIFAGIRKNLTLLPTITRTFKNGSVLLCYHPAP